MAVWVQPNAGQTEISVISKRLLLYFPLEDKKNELSWWILERNLPILTGVLL